MNIPIGRRLWAIADGYIPGGNREADPEGRSHETAGLLNTADDDAHVEIIVYFKDREPIGPYCVTVPARRTRQIRFNELESPEPIPRDTDYSSVIISDVPIVVQHTRLDSRKTPGTLLSTIAFPAVPG